MVESDLTDAAWAEAECQERRRREEEGLALEALLLADLKRSHQEFIECCRRFERMMADRQIALAKRAFR